MAHKTEADFEAEGDMRTLIDAEKIKKDKKRLARAVKKAKEQRDAMSSIMNKDKKES